MTGSIGLSLQWFDKTCLTVYGNITFVKGMQDLFM